jgi:hypothetical protein
MQWRKASDGLQDPKVSPYMICRYVGEKNHRYRFTLTYWEGLKRWGIQEPEMEGLEWLDESEESPSKSWEEVAEQLAKEYAADGWKSVDDGSPTYDELKYKAFLDGVLKAISITQHTWVPVESGTPFPKNELLEFYCADGYAFTSITTNKGEEFIWKRNPTHWRYITPPGSNSNPIVEEWVKMRKALQQIETMKRLPGETTDTYAFNRCYHLATEALKYS